MPNQPKADVYTCRDVVKQATEFLENRLLAAVSVDIWRHMESCAACRTYMEQLALVRDSLHQLRPQKMPDGTRRKLLQRLQSLACNAHDK